MERVVWLIIAVFLIGIVAGIAIASVKPEKNTRDIVQEVIEQAEESQPQVVVIGPKEKPSPKDRIAEDQILVYDSRVVINVRDVEWARFTDTNSMDPVIDEGANALELIPKSEEEIQVGDIIAYESDFASGTIIHRVINKSVDEEGTYFILKGDNNQREDPGKVRFDQIKRVVIGVLY